jgi:CRP-like cAMP-binding protein
VPRPAPPAAWLPALLADPDPWIRTCAAALEGAAVDDAVTTLSDLERVLFLRQVPLFADLSPQDLKRVAEIAREQTYVDGELIAAQGEAGEELHIVVAGEVRVIRRDPAGGTVELARRGPGEVVGELALITRDPRMASLLTAGDVRTLRVGRTEFEGVLRERPETAIAVIRILSHRLAEHAATGP